MIFPGKITAQGRRDLCAVVRRDRRERPNGRVSRPPLGAPWGILIPLSRWRGLPARFMPVAILAGDALTKTGRPWLVRLGAGDLSPEIRVPAPAASGPGDTPGRVLGCRRSSRYGWSWPEPPAGATPSSAPGAGEPWPGPGPAGSRGHERPIGWRCPRALPLGSARALHGPG